MLMRLRGVAALDDSAHARIVVAGPARFQRGGGGRAVQLPEPHMIN